MMETLLAALLGAMAGLLLFILCFWIVEELEYEGDLEDADAPPPPPVPDLHEAMAILRDNRMWATSFALVSGLSSAVVYQRFGPSLAYLCGLAFCFSLISLTFIDRRTYTLPDITTLPTLWLGLGMQLLPATRTIGADAALTGCIMAFLIPAVPSHLYSLLRGRQTMGGGDLKMLAMIGAWLGLVAALGILFVASVLLIVKFLFTGHRKAHLYDGFAFGPYLGVTALIFYMLNWTA